MTVKHEGWKSCESDSSILCESPSLGGGLVWLFKGARVKVAPDPYAYVQGRVDSNMRIQTKENVLQQWNGYPLPVSKKKAREPFVRSFLSLLSIVQNIFLIVLLC